MLEAMILRFGVFRIAVAAFVLIVVLMFAGIAGWNKVKSSWYEGKAERAEVRADKAERGQAVAQADTKQTEVAADIAADTTIKQDRTATGQRQNTAKAIEVIHERIVKVPVIVQPDPDPIVFQQVREARGRAQAAANHVSGASKP